MKMFHISLYFRLSNPGAWDPELDSPACFAIAALHVADYLVHMCSANQKMYVQGPLTRFYIVRVS